MSHVAAEERSSASGTSKYASRLRAEAQLASSGVSHFQSSRINSIDSGRGDNGSTGLGNVDGGLSGWATQSREEGMAQSSKAK